MVANEQCQYGHIFITSYLTHYFLNCLLLCCYLKYKKSYTLNVQVVVSVMKYASCDTVYCQQLAMSAKHVASLPEFMASLAMVGASSNQNEFYHVQLCIFLKPSCLATTCVYVLSLRRQMYTNKHSMLPLACT